MKKTMKILHKGSIYIMGISSINSGLSSAVFEYQRVCLLVLYRYVMICNYIYILYIDDLSVFSCYFTLSHLLRGLEM